MSEATKPQDHVVSADGVVSDVTANSSHAELTGLVSQTALGAVKGWQSCSFAADWFADAVAEAKSNGGRASRRREILFAVCAAEAYLIEWVRDDLLKHDLAALNTYFPSEGKRPGIRERWKRVTKKLFEDGKIRSMPAWCVPEWNDFVDLVIYRDGLVHARASRPETSDLPEEQRPFPSASHLDSLSAGWATTVFVKLVEYVHRSVGTQPPRWLEKP